MTPNQLHRIAAAALAAGDPVPFRVHARAAAAALDDRSFAAWLAAWDLASVAGRVNAKGGEA